MLISFIIPIYNSEKTIKGCLNSILNQKLQIEKEILVINNNSTDNGPEIVRKIPGVRLLNKNKPGPGAARNKGLDNAMGDFIAFVDSDVELPLNWTSTCLEILERDSSLAGVGGPGKSVDSNYVSESLNKLLFGKDEKVTEKYVDSLASMDSLYRGGLLRNLRFNESLIAGEDPELNFRLRKQGYNLLYSEEVFVYHHHPLTIRGMMKKWYHYGKYYTLPYKKHPEFKNKGYYARIFFMSILISSILLSFHNPVLIIFGLVEVLFLFLTYIFIGINVKGGFLFPFVHTLKQLAQISGIFVGMIKRT
jgi:glycosyltransferase involved in cell wall biosynthesis